MLKYLHISSEFVGRALLRAHDPKQAKVRAGFFKDEYKILRSQIHNSNVLVAGSGLGHDAFVLAPNNKFVTGIEIIKPFIGESKKEARKLNIKNIRFLHGDFMKLKPAKKFDVVVLNMGTIGNFDDPTKTLAKLLSLGEVLYFDFYSTQKKALIKRKKMYEEESWSKLYIEGNKIRNQDGFESYSFSKMYIKNILDSLNAKVVFYPISDFAYLAEVKRKQG